MGKLTSTIGIPIKLLNEAQVRIQHAVGGDELGRRLTSARRAMSSRSN
jgi:hypothetical protein